MKLMDRIYKERTLFNSMLCYKKVTLSLEMKVGVTNRGCHLPC